MKLIIDVPDEIVKKGFEGPLTDEERMVIIRAVGNATLYEESQDGAEMYREETCENKSHCYDYEHWHCIGCKEGGAE